MERHVGPALSLPPASTDAPAPAEAAELRARPGAEVASGASGVTSAEPTTAVLHVRGAGKRFDIYPNDRSRFFEFLGSRSHHREHWAVRGIDLEVTPGRAVGVIGSNGAGKSTLLRLLAGITEPTEGSVSVRGRLSALLDLGVGFQENFTGRENLELGCRLLGLGDDEIEARLPDIVRFAELGAFIDDPVRTYSTGMALRLGFSMAVHVSADVLVIDEVLAVGDQAFQRKCIRRIEQMLGDGCGLVLVSHDLHAVRAICGEVVWLDMGRPRMRGPARDVVEAYLDLDRVRAARQRAADARPASDPAPAADAPAPARPTRVLRLATPLNTGSDATIEAMVAGATRLEDAAEIFGDEAGDAPRVEDAEGLRVSGTGEARILQVRMLDAQGRPQSSLRTGESLIVAVTFRTTEPVDDPIFGVAIFRNDGAYVYGPNTGFDNVLKGAYHGVYTVFIHYPRLPLLAGTYRISVAIYDKGHVRPMAWHNQLYEFVVTQECEDHGLVQLAHTWGVVTHHDALGGRAPAAPPALAAVSSDTDE
jgi:ABC-type polysaccharide/polyol phosphate transport system ATPase subunit